MPCFLWFGLLVRLLCVLFQCIDFGCWWLILFVFWLLGGLLICGWFVVYLVRWIDWLFRVFGVVVYFWLVLCRFRHLALCLVLVFAGVLVLACSLDWFVDVLQFCYLGFVWVCFLWLCFAFCFGVVWALFWVVCCLCLVLLILFVWLVVCDLVLGWMFALLYLILSCGLIGLDWLAAHWTWFRLVILTCFGWFVLMLIWFSLYGLGCFVGAYVFVLRICWFLIWFGLFVDLYLAVCLLVCNVVLIWLFVVFGVVFTCSFTCLCYWFCLFLGYFVFWLIGCDSGSF